MSDTTPSSARAGTFARLFLDHPASVDETYFQHMRFAGWFSFWLATAAGAALLHAIVPAVCETTASRIIRRLYARIENRHAAQ
ncbi:MAG: hypothetical protein GC146_09225 [Limimaricola sp.]|uniref:DUF6356 family protein n=1 Tax=Limimaricola sp. TaxID=2211665 RepID=UPI001D81964C|nr:DUF6356 family protein [Limimaricola sp.]MBI1417391.1 hypothetical protein [Limimaricola sp.]